MRGLGLEPFAYAFEASHSCAALQAEWANLDAGAVDEAADVSICGRVVAKRIFGKKLAFFSLRDATRESGWYRRHGRMACAPRSAGAFAALLLVLASGIGVSAGRNLQAGDRQKG